MQHARPLGLWARREDTFEKWTTYVPFPAQTVTPDIVRQVMRDHYGESNWKDLFSMSSRAAACVWAERPGGTSGMHPQFTIHIPMHATQRPQTNQRDCHTPCGTTHARRLNAAAAAAATAATRMTLQTTPSSASRRGLGRAWVGDGGVAHSHA